MHIILPYNFTTKSVFLTYCLHTYIFKRLKLYCETPKFKLYHILVSVLNDKTNTSLVEEVEEAEQKRKVHVYLCKYVCILLPYIAIEVNKSQSDKSRQKKGT